MSNENKNTSAIFANDDGQKFGKIIADTITSYLDKGNDQTIEDWFKQEYHKNFPDIKDDSISQEYKEIANTLELLEGKLSSLRKAKSNGVSASYWFKREVEKSLADNSPEESRTILDSLSKEINLANQDNLNKAKDLFPDFSYNPTIKHPIEPQRIPNIGELADALNEDTLELSITSGLSGASEYALGQMISGEKIDKDKLIEASLKDMPDSGLKVALSTALKIGSENNVLPQLPPNTHNGTLVSMAHVTTERLSTNFKLGSGIIDTAMANVNMAETTVSTVAAAAGAKWGGTIGSVFGPVGTAVGAFAGGVIGKIAGSKVTNAVKEGIGSVAKAGVSVIKSVVSGVASGVKSVISSVGSFLSSFW